MPGYQVMIVTYYNLTTDSRQENLIDWKRRIIHFICPRTNVLNCPLLMDMVNFMVNLACNVLLQRWSGNAQTYDCSTTFPLCITLSPMFFSLLLFYYKQAMKNVRDIFKTYKLLY